MTDLSYLDKDDKIKQIANVVKTTEGIVSISRTSNISKTTKDKKYKEQTKNIIVENFDNILEINLEENYIVCEPYVTMEKIVDTLLKHKKSIKVATEFKNITLGGGILGGAGESSSFKYGLLHNNVISYEIIDENGNVLFVDKNHKLFNLIPGSYGSLCLLTKIKIEIHDIKKNVKVSFIRSKDIIYEDLFDNNYDFIDGVIISKNNYVIIKGLFTDENSNNVSLLKKTDKLFYDIVIDKNIHEITCPYKDYVFRWDRGSFWISHLVGYNDIYTSGTVDPSKDDKDILSTDSLYKMLMSRKETERESNLLVNDIIIPMKNTKKFEEYIDNNLNIYPLWLCPILYDNTCDFFKISKGNYINFGIYGYIDELNDDFISTNKKIEKKVFDCSGIKCLYGQSYYDENTFYSIYPKIISKKFVNLYDKSCEFYKSINQYCVYS